MLGGDLNTYNDRLNLPFYATICGSVEQVNGDDTWHALLIYPNPASSIVYFELEESAEKISLIALYNIHGRLVAEWHPQAHTAALDISHLSGGIYLARATVGQKVITRKVVVR